MPPEKKSKSRKGRRAAPYRLPPINSNFWPTIKEAIKTNPEQINRHKIPCMVCRLPMKIGETDDPNKCSEMIMLPCGHVLGNKCFQELSSHDSWRSKCPQCLTTLKHSECGHAAEPIIFQDFEKVINLFTAKTLVSEGGRLLPQCTPCAMRMNILRACRSFYVYMTDEEEEYLGTRLIFSLGTSFGWMAIYDILCHPIPALPVQDDRNYFTCRCPKWTRDYRTCKYFHPKLMNSKTTMPHYLAPILEGAWGPHWMDIWIGLPWDPADRVGDPPTIIDAIIDRIPDIDEESSVPRSRAGLD